MLLNPQTGNLLTLLLLCLPIAVGADSARASEDDGPRFTKLGANGNELVIQDRDWVDRGKENEGTQWRCVRDNATGLTWEVKTWENWREVYNFARATAHARNATICGLPEWRIPSSLELLSIVDQGAPSGPKIDKHFFNHAREAFYWSSEVYAPYPAFAVGVHFGSGAVTTANQSGRNNLRLVHGGR